MQKKCYKLETSQFGRDWETSSTKCKALNGNLASIKSECEQKVVAQLANKVSVWIGGNDLTTEGTFIWPNSEEFFKAGAVVSGVYTKLSSTAFSNSGQENQDCVQMQEDGEWDDIVCTKFQNYICEKAAYIGAATYVAPTTTTAPKGINHT